MVANRGGSHFASRRRTRSTPPAEMVSASSSNTVTLAGRTLALAFVFTTLYVSHLPAQQTPPANTQDQQLQARADSADDRKPFLNVIFPEALPPLLPDGTARDWLRKNRLRMYGWLD